MGSLQWFGENWFNLLQSLGIAASLIFTAASFRNDTKARRVASLIELTKQHRAIWTELDRRTELNRILDTTIDLERSPVTPEEERFLNILILHLNAAFHAMKEGVFMEPDGLAKDVRRFFSRPVAKAVWQRTKTIRDNDFVQFVEKTLMRTKGAI